MGIRIFLNNRRLSANFGANLKAIFKRLILGRVPFSILGMASGRIGVYSLRILTIRMKMCTAHSIISSNRIQRSFSIYTKL